MNNGRILAGRFELRRLLGRGGMGEVYLAFDQVLERQVAVKTVLPSLFADRRAVEQLRKEVRISQELRHPNICATYDLHQGFDQPFIVMEYVDGETLGNFIYGQPDHRCDEQTFLRLARQILDAVEHAHQAGVVHRDLKSQNIMVKPDGTTRVMDFGIAASLKETYSRTTGTPISLSIHYSSPEQINGEPPAVSMDIYSLGCIFYEMLSGEPPFTRGEILYQHLNEVPRPLPEVSPALNRTVLACLEKDPARRPQTVAAVRGLLAGEKMVCLPRRTAAPEAEQRRHEELNKERERQRQEEARKRTAEQARQAEPVRRRQPPGMFQQQPKTAASGWRVWWVLGLVLGVFPVVGLVGYQSYLAEQERLAEQQWQAEQARQAEQERVAEQKRLAEQVKEAERKRQAEQKRLAEQARLAKVIAAMEFVQIPPGEFEMGCSPGDGDCYPSEKPLHKVRITKGFAIGKYEVTQAQWEAVMGNNPSEFKAPDRPVENVSWNGVQEFLAKLNARNDGHHYRLPTEAEWEYAARAGTKTVWYGYRADEVGNSGNQTHPVGQKRPNRWGLYDTLGNVWEWCADWYQKDYYRNSPATDPRGPSNGKYRVLRGGSWNDVARRLRVSDRGGYGPDGRSNYVGFRCARE